MSAEPVRTQPDDPQAERDRLATLHAAIEAGLNSGPAIPAEEVLAELRARYAAKA